MKLNHVLIQAKNMNAMREFLTGIIGLEVGYRPPFPFKGAWLYSNNQPLIHLVESSPEQGAQADYLGSDSGNSANLVDHIALQGADYSQLMSQLAQHDIEFTERTIPVSRAHQVFVRGPEGLRIEMLFGHDKNTLH